MRYLQRYLRDYEQNVSLLELNEKLLPRLRRSLDCRGDYYDLAIAAMERAAEEAGLEPFHIYTEDELMAALRREYREPAGRYPKFLTKALIFRSPFVRSKSLWRKD